MDDSDIDETQLKELAGVMSVWKSAIDAGQPPGFAADMLLHAETGQSFGWDSDLYSNVVDFCDFFTFATKERTLTDAEVIVVANRARTLRLEVESSSCLSRVRKSFTPKRWWHFWK